MAKRLFIFLEGILILGSVGCSKVEYADSNTQGYIQSEKDAYIMDDGTAVSVWQPEKTEDTYSYRLADGQELLIINYLGRAEDSHSGLEGFDGMEKQAQQAVLDYYEAQGSFLDTESLVRDAYEDYQLCMEEEKRFKVHPADEDVSPCVETERFTGFLKEINVPDILRYEETETVDNMQQITLFDRSTGEVIPPKDLFCISEEEAIKAVAELCETEESNISLEDIIWAQENVELHLPAENDTYAYELVNLTYDQLKEILCPWAIPVSEK